VALRDAETGQCLTPDGDGDGVRPCDDCDDADPDISPNLRDVCDGVNNDCRGGIDDPDDVCDTGVPGACAAGRPWCDGLVERCVPTALPLDEQCANGVDDDCDDQTDESSGDDPLTPCRVPGAGDTCLSPIPIVAGGDQLAGRLVDAPSFLPFLGCGLGPLPSVVYALPFDRFGRLRVDPLGSDPDVVVAVVPGDCELGSAMACVAATDLPWVAELFGPPFVYVVVQDASGGSAGRQDLDYRVLVGVEEWDGTCRRGDEDGDTVTVCTGTAPRAARTPSRARPRSATASTTTATTRAGFATSSRERRFAPLARKPARSRPKADRDPSRP